MIANVIGAVDFYAVVDRLAPGRKGTRCPAPWRKTRDLNVSLNPGKRTYYDFTESRGGGILDFVSRCTGNDRAGAFRWLADFAGIPLEEQTATERAEWIRRRRAAEREAVVFEQWLRGQIADLSIKRDYWFRVHHYHSRRIIRYSFNHPSANWWADVAELAEERYQALDAALDTLRDSSNLPRLLTDFRSEPVKQVAA